MYAWWADVVKESITGDHTPVVKMHHRYGMILFIASEVMFFVAWFWAYFDQFFRHDDIEQYARVEFMGPTWPPTGVELFDPFHLPLFNTLILLTSGTTVTWAHHALIHNDRNGLKVGLWLTIALGALFTCRAGHRVLARRLRLSRQHLWRDLLHGDRLPRLPRAGRHDLPDRLLDPRLCRQPDAEAPPRFRVRRLVLALRRRGLAVPVCRHLCVGQLGRADRTTAKRGTA